ncbi:MAG: DUF1704 domain-containing protein [Proteobacteria bacterium]|nr:DUF1704 domain-containing protein [Pseudomonadota bacterium]MCP4917491.1 DUF1704 domain-containing protein [Pseudomonadota bacterium]
MSIPPAVLQVDRELHTLFERVPFSRYLNPVNAREARQAFRAGRDVPPLRYHTATWADAELGRLDRLEPPEDHPLGQMLARGIHGTRLFILALRDRTPEAFDRLARNSNWYPDEETLESARGEVRDRDTTPFSLSAAVMVEALEDALRDRGLGDWRIELDPVMSARVLVDGAKRLLRVSPRATFRSRDVRRLVVHEVEVHAIRSANGRAQPLRIFSTGLPGSLETEEGLALYAEELSGSASPGTAWRQGVVVQAVDWARRMGFRELHDTIAENAGPGLAWGVSERLKRGLADPGAPGVYAKDVVYYRGHRRVKAYLEAGKPVKDLFVGKVGLDDPVSEWLDAGLITHQPVPATFR